MTKNINFYSVSECFGEFSNFARFPITLNGHVWPTSEHYFQAMKFLSLDDQNEIREAESAFVAAQKGRERSRILRSDWETVKLEIMREAVLAKFTQHEKLAQLLLSTENANLVEHTKLDNYWGDGGDGTGQNMLGKILMEVRSILQG